MPTPSNTQQKKCEWKTLCFAGWVLLLFMWTEFFAFILTCSASEPHVLFSGLYICLGSRWQSVGLGRVCTCIILYGFSFVYYISEHDAEIMLYWHWHWIKGKKFFVSQTRAFCNIKSSYFCLGMRKLDTIE